MPQALEERVLSGLIGDGLTDAEALARIRLIRRKLTGEFFTGKRRVIAQVAINYALHYSGKLTQAVFLDALKLVHTAEEDLVDYASAFTQLLEQDVMDRAQFEYMLTLLREEVKKEKFASALEEAGEILVAGKKIGSQHYAGLSAARRRLAEQLAAVDALVLDETAEGAVNEEKQDVLEEYLRQKRLSKIGVRTGFPTIDGLTQGILPAELWLVAAFTAEGKSVFCVNLATSALLQGKHVVIATAETSRKQYRRRLLCRLSKDDRFDFQQGISSKALKEGSLSDREEEVLQAVLDEMPKLGRVDLFQIPKGASIDFLDARLSRYGEISPVDLMIVDEVRLLTPPRKRNTLREELNDAIIGLKQIATSYENGRGVGVISPYQVSRSAYQEALKRGYYGKDCFAESAEAERSADFAVSLLRMEDSKSTHRIKARVLKYRDGEDEVDFDLLADFDKAHMQEGESTSFDPESMIDFSTL